MLHILTYITAATRRSPPPVDPGNDDGIYPVLTAQYIDGSGVRQTTTIVNGETTITGQGPLIVAFDTDGTTSDASNCDTAAGAWLRLGFRFRSGENNSTAWTYGGGRRDESVGTPLWRHVYPVGEHTSRVRYRDPDGREATVTFTVVASDPGEGTTISEGGSWPTWASNTVYNLAAGTDHTAKGTVNHDGRHNVLIRKTGEGANPIIAGFAPDSRHIVGTVVERTRHCRLLGVDCSSYTENPVGPEYCGVIDGRCTVFNGASGGTTYYWSEVAATETERNNICFPRSTVMWNTGEMNAGGTGYVVAGVMGLNHTFRGVDFHKDSGGGGTHVFRGMFRGLDLQYCRLYSTSTVVSHIKIHGYDNGDDNFVAWRDDDRVGLSGGSQYQYVTGKCCIRSNVFGATGDTYPTGSIGVTPENPDVGPPAQGIDLVMVEHNVWHRATPTGMNIGLGGRNLSARDNFWDMGNGDAFGVSTSFNPQRIPTGWDGPYITSGTRPVPTAFD